MSFSLLQQADFLGRTEELAALLLRVNAAAKGQASGVVLYGAAGIGKTELLKQLYGSLFWKQQRIIPLYYCVNPALLSAATFAQDYLTQALCQAMAFEKKEQSLLSFEGMSLDNLAALIEKRGASWAGAHLGRFLAAQHNPVDALRTALGTPRQIALSTGTPVAVLIDEFDRLQGLYAENAAGADLVSLFETALSFGKTPHIVSGNAAAVQEMAVTNVLERFSLSPLGPEDALSKARSLLQAFENEGTDPPQDLLRHLGGNPFYLSCVVKRACAKGKPSGEDYWKAYAAEIDSGALSSRWISTFKNYFPGLSSRNSALAAAHRLCHANEPFSVPRIAKAFALSLDDAEAVLRGLYLAGIVRGEFGVFRAADDNVLHDLIDYLYRKEVEGRSVQDLQQKILERQLAQQSSAVHYQMTLPMTKETELVAAQCLDQIGKNLDLNRDAVGQLQIAVIEACINAIEHSGGTDRNIYLTFKVDGETMEASVESTGQEYILQETGEPYEDKTTKTAGRGWGIKLMKRFVDEVRFEKTPKGTKTVLIKKLAATGEVEKESNKERE